MVSIPVLLAFGAMLSWGIGDFLIQRSTRKVGNLQTLAIIGIIGSIGLTPFIIRDIPLLMNPANIILLGALGIIAFVTAILNFEALKQGKLSVIDVILELELPITVVLSIFFFKEILSGYQFAIIAVVMLGIICMAIKSFDHLKSKIEKGVWIALIAAILYGIVNFLTASGSKIVSPLMAVWFPWVIFTIITLVAIHKRKEMNEFKNNIKQFSSLLIITGIMDTLAWVFYAFAVVDSETAIITAITESYPAVAMTLGMWYNKEVIKFHQICGAVIAIIGSIILGISL